MVHCHLVHPGSSSNAGLEARRYVHLARENTLESRHRETGFVILQLPPEENGLLRGGNSQNNQRRAVASRTVSAARTCAGLKGGAVHTLIKFDWHGRPPAKILIFFVTRDCHVV